MKPAILFAFGLALNISIASAQTFRSKEVKMLLDTSILLMKQHAVNANTVNWAEVTQSVYKKASDLNSPYEMGDVMRYLYKSLKDFHGGFKYRDSVFKWHGKEVTFSDSIQNQFKIKAGIKTQLLDANIGYLKVPSMSGGNVNEWSKKAQALNDSLCSLLAYRVKGIILDLRINGGGSMFPMILGLKQLLGEGKVGSFENKNEDVWQIKGNRFYIDTSLLAVVIPKLTLDATALPVVIITSPVTGSSGEFLIIAFKGRKNTILLGSETAGYVTANEGFSINNRASILLSAGYGKDRNGNGYKKAIEPDINFTGVDKFNDLPNDEKVKAAIKWLKQH